MTTFRLPDLGEGLPEAEIVAWHVAEGDSIKVDELLVSVETAKAVVEVPSPYSGTVARLHAKAGDVVATGAPLVDFSDAQDGEQEPAPPRPMAAEARDAAASAEEPARSDAGTVVGNVMSGDDVVKETAIAGRSRRRSGGRVKAAPAVRAEAKRRGVDLSEVSPSGKNGQVTQADLERFRERARPAARQKGPQRASEVGQREALRGPRRAMSQSMTRSRDEVALCTLFDDADIDEWLNKRDFTPRILRAIVAGCAAEPAVNGFYHADDVSRQLETRVDVAIAVDTGEGLIVPVVRGVEHMDLDEIRNAVARIKEATRNRTVAPQDMVNYTITLSNFGTLAGRYATPLLVPPTMAIVGTGKLQHDVVAVMGGIEVHRRIPLSLSFDHRAVTGGEAARFLAAVIADLEKPQ